MNRTGLRVLAIGILVLFWGVNQVSSQTAAPVPPTLPGTPYASLGVTVNKIVSDAIASANSANRTVLLNSRVLNGLPEKRLNVDLVDVPLREALKRVLDDSKTPYILDEDVPSAPKVSIRLTNAPLTTILDALTISNNIGWRTEFKRTTTTTETTKTSTTEDKDKQTRVRGLSGTYFSAASSGSFTAQIHVGKTVTILPNSLQLRTLDIEGPPSSALRYDLRGMGVVAPQASQLRIYRWQSEKRTFTCPRCHNMVSILQQPEEIKCAKCHRPFEANWKVCPFDGTKRPESRTKWRYCPICGKAITQEAILPAPLVVAPENPLYPYRPFTHRMPL